MIDPLDLYGLKRAFARANDLRDLVRETADPAFLVRARRALLPLPIVDGHHASTTRSRRSRTGARRERWPASAWPWSPRAAAERLARRVLVQAAAWGCRIAVVYFLLAAFGLPASVPTAALVMVVSGLSTLVPLTPGGTGTQQVLLAYALQQTVTAAAAISFSLGMQAGVTAVNAVLGVAAAMVAFCTVRPLAAVRSGLAQARGRAMA